jgi:hypothetical protein
MLVAAVVLDAHNSVSEPDPTTFSAEIVRPCWSFDNLKKTTMMPPTSSFLPSDPTISLLGVYPRFLNQRDLILVRGRQKFLTGFISDVSTLYPRFCPFPSNFLHKSAFT